MAQQRLSMRKIKEVLRLKYDSGLSHRQIAASCDMAHSTVASYLTLAQTAGIPGRCRRVSRTKPWRPG